MKFDVISVSLTKDGSYGLKNGKLLVRTERIDTDINILFHKTKSRDKVKKYYEAFWRLNRNWLHGQCKVLKVISVEDEKEVE